jgi:hypothetical protein
MAEIITLTKTEYLIGQLDEDPNPIIDMILSNYNEGRNMSKDITNIRYEDIRINFTPQIQRIAKKLCDEWYESFGDEIELCWQNKEGQDPNSSFWAVIHSPNESTNLHSHETSDNYESGAHVSAAIWVQVPPNSGNLVFQYHVNPYKVRQEEVEGKPCKFAMFDSTLPHYVTKNLSNEQRIVISMNFRYKNY